MNKLNLAAVQNTAINTLGKAPLIDEEIACAQVLLAALANIKEETHNDGFTPTQLATYIGKMVLRTIQAGERPLDGIEWSIPDKV